MSNNKKFIEILIIIWELRIAFLVGVVLFQLLPDFTLGLLLILTAFIEIVIQNTYVIRWIYYKYIDQEEEYKF